MGKPRWLSPVPNTSDAPPDWPALITVAATVLGEAEGEPRMGKIAVAWTIMNRTEDARWPNDPGDVCLQRLQFSSWNPDSPRLRVMYEPMKHTSEAIWNACFLAATQAMFRLEPDPVGGANHFLAPGSLSQLPVWAREDRIVARIGEHVFYRL